jgi:AraC family transcriptional regulator
MPGRVVMTELLSVFKTASFKIHHPSARKRAVIDHAFTQYTLGFQRLLALHLLRFYAVPAAQHNRDPHPGLTRQQLQQVVDFVKKHIHQNLPLSSLAQLTGYSPYHFARLFRQSTGHSPYQFILHQRVAYAKHLLGNTSLPLARIALKCGFANQSHLTQVFKRFMGLTPSAYRKNNR